MSSDPWKHRSAKMKCKTCMWFVAKKVSAKIVASSKDMEDLESVRPGGLIKESTFNIGSTISDHGQIGRCRKHAPTADGYPVVFSDDWCGDHKLDEEKC